jgi:hypothetical protein
MRVVAAAAPMLTPREKRKIWGPLDGGPSPTPEPEADRNGARCAARLVSCDVHSD